MDGGSLGSAGLHRNTLRFVGAVALVTIVAARAAIAVPVSQDTNIIDTVWSEIAVSRDLPADFTGDHADASSPSGFSLTATSGKSPDAAAAKVLRDLAPHLAQACVTLETNRRTSAGGTTHQIYGVRCGRWFIDDASIALSWRDGRPVLGSVQLPRAPLSADIQTPPRPLAELRPARASADATPGIALADVGGEIAPVWITTEQDELLGTNWRVIVDGRTGSVVRSEPMQFHIADAASHHRLSPLMANVFPRSPLDQVTSTEALTGIDGPGLDGPKLSVTSKDPATRDFAASFDGAVMLSPNVEADRDEFDLLQTWFGASQALAWFQNELGWTPATTTMPGKMAVEIHTTINGSPNNAGYFAATSPGALPTVRIGRGDGVILADLARDNDVVAHEIAHHVLYRAVTSARGASGIWHEGTADYLVYAMRGDPYLGRSIKPGAISLRSALIDPSRRLDDPRLRPISHELGEIWSAMLWAVREEVGTQFDRVVYYSADYLPEQISLRDAMLALIEADRALSDAGGQPAPTEQLAPHGTVGPSYCAILKHGVARGLATTVATLDGAPCGLDLATLAEESRQFTALHAPRGKKGKNFSVSIAGRKCAVIGNPDKDEAANSGQLPLLILLGAIPLLFAWRPNGPRQCPREQGEKS